MNTATQSKAYSTKANAARAAKAALSKLGKEDAVVNKDFQLVANGDKFAWIEIKPEVKAEPKPEVKKQTPVASIAQQAKASIAATLTNWKKQDAEQPADMEGGYKIEKNRPTQNGVTRPSEGGLCRAVWDACDELALTAIPGPKDIKAWANENGYKETNAVIELYQWRKFNGITGRVKAGTTLEQYNESLEAL